MKQKSLICSRRALIILYQSSQEHFLITTMEGMKLWVRLKFVFMLLLVLDNIMRYLWSIIRRIRSCFFTLDKNVAVATYCSIINAICLQRGLGFNGLG